MENGSIKDDKKVVGRRRAGENGSIKDDKKVVGRRRRGKRFKQRRQ